MRRLQANNGNVIYISSFYNGPCVILKAITELSRLTLNTVFFQILDSNGPTLPKTEKKNSIVIVYCILYYSIIIKLRYI